MWEWRDYQVTKVVIICWKRQVFHRKCGINAPKPHEIEGVPLGEGWRWPESHITDAPEKNAFLKAISLSHACHEWVPWIVRCSDNGRKCGKKCPFSPVIGHFRFDSLPIRVMIGAASNLCVMPVDKLLQCDFWVENWFFWKSFWKKIWSVRELVVPLQSLLEEWRDSSVG